MALTPRRAIAGVGLAVVVLVALNIFAGRIARSWDLTAERSATLSESTRRVLAHVDRRIDITAFFPREAPGRVEAATLLSRYRKLNRRITFRVLDPALQPGEVRRLGVSAFGSAAVSLRGTDRVEVGQYTIEIDVTSAIARLLRDVSGTVCYATGHGERDPSGADADGLSRSGALLRANGYRVREVDLLADPAVPRSCDALVVAAPTASFAAPAIDAVVSYLENGGKGFVLGDPDADADLTPLVRAWGIGFVPGVVVEGDANSHLPEDVTAPIVRRYDGASSVVRGLGPTFFPRVEKVQARAGRDPGLSAGPVARTTELSYLDRRDPGSFDPKVDQKGPVPVAASADESEVLNPGAKNAKILRTRILAVGDVDFASNQFFEDASNAKLWIQGIDWLTQPEDLVTAVPNFPRVRSMELTEARSRYILLLMAAVVPGLFVIAGGLVWVVRRGR